MLFVVVFFLRILSFLEVALCSGTLAVGSSEISRKILRRGCSSVMSSVEENERYHYNIKECLCAAGLSWIKAVDASI